MTNRKLQIFSIHKKNYKNTGDNVPYENKKCYCDVITPLDVPMGRLSLNINSHICTTQVEAAMFWKYYQLSSNTYLP